MYLRLTVNDGRSSIKASFMTSFFSPNCDKDLFHPAKILVHRFTWHRDLEHVERPIPSSFAAENMEYSTTLSCLRSESPEIDDDARLSVIVAIPHSDIVSHSNLCTQSDRRARTQTAEEVFTSTTK